MPHFFVKISDDFLAQIRQFIVAQAVAQIPWGHNIVLLDKITDSEQRRWYAETCQKNGWSRNVLIHQIESGLYERQVLNSKVSNFKQRLPSPQSELATQTMKDMLSSVCSAYQLSARAFSILHGKNNQKLTNLGQVVSCRVGEKTVYWNIWQSSTAHSIMGVKGMYKLIIVDDEEKIAGGMAQLFPWQSIGFE
ncbi:DUF1016 N-terminal domain-containing protein, partial [uncultured Gemmiger sp.]|uniref:DUF1016 N-terminal domain-containing protein n=1 Tax=uncultured Gemmiger sp. TaxID=1623490 RepID=UPI00344C731A